MMEQLLQLINQERAKIGVKPLAFRSDILAASNLRAKEASVSWSHTRPNGQPYWSADDRIWGENLAKNYKTPQEVITAWLNSELHRKNMLNPKYSGACIGIFEEGGKRFISLEFTK